MNEDLRLLAMCAVMACGLGLYLWLAVFRTWREHRALNLARRRTP